MSRGLGKTGNLTDNPGERSPISQKLTVESELGPGDLLLVVANQKAGSGGFYGRVEGLVQRVSNSGLEVIVESNVEVVAKKISIEWQSGRKLCVVAAGGDGTLNLLASVLGPGVPLMPLPLGTENLVARHFGLMGPNGEFDLETAVQTVLRGNNRVVDAGVASFLRRNGKRREKRFLIMASVGFDAEVVRRMHLTRKGHINRWSYFKPIMAVLRRYRYPRIRVETIPNLSINSGAGGQIETAQDTLTVAWALLFNLPRYAAGLSIESLADETDGELDFCGLSYGSHIHGLRYLYGVLIGQHKRWADVKRFRASGFRLTSSKPVAVQLDGDYAGRLPMDVWVEPQRVTLRLPEGLKTGEKSTSIERG